MFAPLHQCRNRQAGMNPRVSMMHSTIAVATIPATHTAAWTFGYAKPLQRPSEHSH
jgi:hypothetical protein